MTATIETIRGDLRALIEQTGRPGMYRFDELVNSYVERYGLKQFSEIGSMVEVLYLVSEHEIDTPVEDPCPSWCEVGHGHRYTSYDPDTGQETRSHSYRLGEHVDLVLEERAGEPLFTRPIRLWVTVDADQMTGAEVRALAAELLNAADELDKVTNGGDRWTEDEL